MNLKASSEEKARAGECEENCGGFGNCHDTEIVDEDVVVIGAGTIGDIVDVVYVGIPPGLRPAAVHQVAVQLKKPFDDCVVWYEQGLAEEQTEVRAR